MSTSLLKTLDVGLNNSLICRYTIVGINLGFCLAAMPELFTSLLFEDINSWVRNVSSTYHESTICEENTDEPPYRAVKAP